MKESKVPIKVTSWNWISCCTGLPLVEVSVSLTLLFWHVNSKMFFFTNIMWLTYYSEILQYLTFKIWINMFRLKPGFSERKSKKYNTCTKISSPNCLKYSCISSSVLFHGKPSTIRSLGLCVSIFFIFVDTGFSISSSPFLLDSKTKPESY